jgi:hypothetical protein
VNPSSCNRWTNFRVSKWWSRDWRAVAWKAWWCDGFCRMLGFDRGAALYLRGVKDLLAAISEGREGCVRLEESVLNALTV